MIHSDPIVQRLFDELSAKVHAAEETLENDDITWRVQTVRLRLLIADAHVKYEALKARCIEIGEWEEEDDAL